LAQATSRQLRSPMCAMASFEHKVAVVEAAARGAAQGGGSRQVVAAAVAAAMRVALGGTDMEHCKDHCKDDNANLRQSLMKRKKVVCEAMEAQHTIANVMGKDYHNLGTALVDARAALPRDERVRLRRLQRNRNVAMHDWSEYEDKSKDEKEDNELNEQSKGEQGRNDKEEDDKVGKEKDECDKEKVKEKQKQKEEKKESDEQPPHIVSLLAQLARSEASLEANKQML